MEKIRTKFKCIMVTRYEDGSELVVLSVITRGIPAGEIKIHIDNPETAGMFEPGAPYYVDIQKITIEEEE